MRVHSAQQRLKSAANDFRVAGTWVLAFLLCLAYLADTRAQSPPPTVLVSPIIQVEAPGSIPFSVIAGPPESLPPNSFIRIRGLPDTVSLSDGRRAKGFWDVPLSSSLWLKINVPAGFSGNVAFIVALVDAQGTVIAESASALVSNAVAGGDVRRDEGRDDGVAQAEKKADEDRLAATAKWLEGIWREVEELEATVKADEKRITAPEAGKVAQANEAKRIAEAKEGEDARKAAEAKQAAMMAQETLKRAAEAEKLARAEEARKAAEAKIDDERKATEAKQAELMAQEALKRAAEAERRAQAEEARKVAEAKKIDDERKAAEAKQAELMAQEALKRAAEAEKEARAEKARKATEQRTDGVPSPTGRVSNADPNTTTAAPAQEHHGVGPTSSVPPGLESSQSERLYDRGERSLSDGNIVIARQYFMRAAQMGHARAAFRLAETFDSSASERFKMQADLNEAKRWYARALELGDEEARARLAQLAK